VHHAARAKAGGVTAAGLMTSPAATIGPDETVEHAARLMYDRKVKRLPVVDPAGRPIGIISRTDVLAVFDRTDAAIREEIMSQVITGRSEPSLYSVLVRVGVVTLEGTPETALRKASLIAIHAWHAPQASVSRAGTPYPPPALHAAAADAARELTLLLDRWQEKYPDMPVGRDVVHGHPGRALADLSARADLVVLGRHPGLPGPGSVRHAVLNHAHGPIVIVPSS
jgi:CBS domain-containing protein